MNFMALMAMCPEAWEVVDSKKEVEEIKKKCLTCGKEHSHNNAFCSGKCCKNYKKS